MMWEDSFPQHDGGEPEQESPFNFDFFSLLSKPKDYYKILEVDYDASEEAIRSNYIRLALKWHPDKQKGQDDVTSRFQEINEAYQVLSDPAKRREYDTKGMLHVHDYNIVEYLNRYKGLILTCNGLGIRQSICESELDRAASAQLVMVQSCGVQAIPIIRVRFGYVRYIGAEPDHQFIDTRTRVRFYGMTTAFDWSSDGLFKPGSLLRCAT